MTQSTLNAVLDAPPAAPQTKRRVFAQLLICRGCCCGQTENGHAPVPTDWLRREWQKRKLMYRIDLTIPYCLGPCDVCNVVCVLTPQSTLWLGGLNTHQQYASLLDWATQSARAGIALPLPELFQSHIFERFREAAADKKENSP